MKDYMNDPKYSEYQVILEDQFQQAEKLNVDDCMMKTLELIRELAKQLNDDDCYKYTERMKKWFNKGGI
jgi:hypothetical protein|tara:strand:+ start:322 stop:528 length:207 start_codon:yes stop_codon:yes gene_type:complete